MSLENYVIGMMIVLFGALGGNWLGDTATLRDCATKGRAVMVGGGTIICEVKKI